jgi:CheY-like chemotaxis protein
VEDTGVGIPSDLIESMFNPSFTQAHRQSGGTGLGLYSLAKRIEALGGDYGVHKKSAEDETDKEKGVHSAQNRGSVFWFTIPYRPDRRAAAQEETARQYERQQREKQEVSAREAINKQGEAPSLRKPPTAASVTRALSFGTSFSGSQLALSHPRAATNLSAVLGMTMSGRQKSSSSPLNILLVDDSLPILKMCGMLFRKQGHKVTTAENGQEALDRLEEESSLHTATMSAHFDVILMDLQMPVMDGLEATGRIRDAERAYAAKTALLQNDMVVDEIEAPSPYTRRGLARVDTAHFRREDHPHLLIIGVSACDDNDTIQGAFSAGIDAFIPKPCTIKSFNDTYDKHHKRLLEACEGFDSGD